CGTVLGGMWQITPYRPGRFLLLARGLLGARTIVALWGFIKGTSTGFGWSHSGAASILGDWRDGISSAGLGNSGHVADFLAVGLLFWMANLLLIRKTAGLWLCWGALWLHAAAMIVCWSLHSNLSLIVGG